SQISATSAGEPTKFGTGFGVRFQTKTLCPAARRPAATRVPMRPRPIRPTFLRVFRDIPECGRDGGLMDDRTRGRDYRARPISPSVHFHCNYLAAGAAGASGRLIVTFAPSRKARSTPAVSV